MKIENPIKTIAGLPVGEPQARPAKSEQTEGASGASGDSVQLSAQLQSIEKSLAGGEVFDAARVEEIKQAISEGRFAVNPEKVADRLLETVRELIQARRG